MQDTEAFVIYPWLVLGSVLIPILMVISLLLFFASYIVKKINRTKVGISLLILVVLISVVFVRLPSTASPGYLINGSYKYGIFLLQANRLPEAKQSFEEALRLQQKYESTWFLQLFPENQYAVTDTMISELLSAINGGSIHPDELAGQLRTQETSSIHYLISETTSVSMNEITVINIYDDETLLVLNFDINSIQCVLENCLDCYEDLLGALEDADLQYLDYMNSEAGQSLEYYYIFVDGEQINGWWQSESPGDEDPPWVPFSAKVTTIAEQALVNGEVITSDEYQAILQGKEQIYGSGSIKNSFWSEQYFKVINRHLNSN
ncbi:hypothetical protein KAU08_02250 [bacterium]|nr:hypothetical protein [bacterium]